MTENKKRPLLSSKYKGVREERVTLVLPHTLGQHIEFYATVNGIDKQEAAAQIFDKFFVDLKWCPEKPIAGPIYDD